MLYAVHEAGHFPLGNKIIGFRIFYVNPDSLMGVSKKSRKQFKGKENGTIDLQRTKFLEMNL